MPLSLRDLFKYWQFKLSGHSGCRFPGSSPGIFDPGVILGADGYLLGRRAVCQLGWLEAGL